jgi:uncharacterized protein (TIGR03792 family)
MSRAVLIGLAALLLIGLWLGLPLLRPAATSALPPGSSGLRLGESGVVEVLRLKVPDAQRSCWSQAEALSWDPWLRQQAGYRGRELLWDAKRQEGVLLIGWSRQADWDAIPAAQLEALQALFEAEARRCLALEEGAANPFPLLSSGALLPER